MDDRVSKSKPSQLKKPELVFDGLSAGQIGELVLSSSDVSLVVEPDGVISDIGYAASSLFREIASQWEGQSLQSVVTVESLPKIEMLMRDSKDLSSIVWRQVNHPTTRYGDVPVSYASFQLGNQDRILILGKDMRRLADEQRRVMNFQLSMERAYSKLQTSELRYRKIFQSVKEAVLIVDCSTLRVIEANNAATRLFGTSSNKLENRKLKDLLGKNGLEPADAFMQAALGGRTLHDVDLIGGHGQKLEVGCSLLREDKQPIMILRLTPLVSDEVEAGLAENRLALQSLRAIPDGFLLTRQSGEILWANEAFAKIINVINMDSLWGLLFSQWFDRTGVDYSLLATNLSEHGDVKRFSTVLRGEAGGLENVEVSATELKVDGDIYYGFIVRPVSGADRTMPAEEGLLPYSAEQLTGLVGHMSLKDVVRETTTVIERLCIEAALELTQDNRASAAQLLGVSRQSLYDKMSKTGIDS